MCILFKAHGCVVVCCAALPPAYRPLPHRVGLLGSPQVARKVVMLENDLERAEERAETGEA